MDGADGPVEAQAAVRSPNPLMRVVEPLTVRVSVEIVPVRGRHAGGQAPLKGRLFGTDGVRGVAFEPPLDRPTLTRLGAALAAHLRGAGLPPRVLLAGDTRASTPILAEWVGGAFAAAGGEVHWAGVLPTPAVSHLLRDRGGYGAGVVVSASHNPASDNGVKLVGETGSKLPVEEEVRLEQRLASMPQEVAGAAAARGGGKLAAALPRAAARFPAAQAPERRAPRGGRSQRGCGAGGARVFHAPSEPRCLLIHAEPDGTNINARCGALFPELLAREVRRVRADAGAALDGDGDRAILVTGTGRVLDGDDALLLWARALAGAEGCLAGRSSPPSCRTWGWRSRSAARRSRWCGVRSGTERSGRRCSARVRCSGASSRGT